jgi:hypothetical protein
MLLGYSYLVNILIRIRQWAERNPQEILTVYIDPQDGLHNNDGIIANFVDAGLDKYVYSYNTTRGRDDPRPTLQEMIDSRKTVMVAGLDNSSTVTIGQNRYLTDNNRPDWTWNAKLVTDLMVWRLIVPDNEFWATLYRDSHFCSRRATQDFPWSFGGNPYQAAAANTARWIGNSPVRVPHSVRNPSILR